MNLLRRTSLNIKGADSLDFSKLNKRATIQKKEFINNNGFEEEKITLDKKVWANIKNISGKELIEAEQLKHKARKKAIIRYIKDLDVSINPNSSLEYRLIYKENIYNITNITNINEQNKFLELELESIWL